MIKDNYNVIGVMSGTSLDGIDIVYVNIQKKENWQFNIIEGQTIPYTKKWQRILRELVTLPIKEVEEVDVLYTTYLAKKLNTFIKQHNICDVDFISSHGHTALHQPEKHLTYQIGNRAELAQLTKNLVVCDFRSQDVALNGQGAPLVPIGDQLLFNKYDYCLNLGGFANISTEINFNRIAYDICPVNIVLNQYVSHLGLEYDKDGKLASQGVLNMALLDGLNNLDYYKMSYPKSLGLEWVKDHIYKLIDSFNLEVKDILRTFCEHIAIQISKSISKKNTSVFVTGGGAYNSFVMKRIKANTYAEIIIPDNQIIEYKEALIFAFLGVLKIREEINCLCSVTGADKDHSSGKILFPKNKV